MTALNLPDGTLGGVVEKKQRAYLLAHNPAGVSPS
jgi:hypothetical protein